MTAVATAFDMAAAERLAAPPRLGLYPGYTWLAGESRDPVLRARRREFLRRAPGPFVINWLDDLRVRIHPHDDTAQCLFLTGLFEPNEMTWFAWAVRPGMTVIDVGANCGLYSLIAARRVGPAGRVVAIEASPREAARVRDNFELNGFTHATVISAAAAEAAGRAALRVASWPHSGQNTLGDFIYPGVASEGTQEVDVTSVDKVVAELDLTRVDVLKIDAEGADARVLRGASQTLERFRPSLLIEINDPTLAHQGSHSREIWDALRPLGYAFYTFSPKTADLVPAVQQPHYPETVNLVVMPATPAGAEGRQNSA